MDGTWIADGRAGLAGTRTSKRRHCAPKPLTTGRRRIIAAFAHTNGRDTGGGRPCTYRARLAVFLEETLRVATRGPSRYDQRNVARPMADAIAPAAQILGARRHVSSIPNAGTAFAHVAMIDLAFVRARQPVGERCGGIIAEGCVVWEIVVQLAKSLVEPSHARSRIGEIGLASESDPVPNILLTRLLGEDETRAAAVGHGVRPAHDRRQVVGKPVFVDPMRRIRNAIATRDERKARRSPSVSCALSENRRHSPVDP